MSPALGTKLPNSKSRVPHFSRPLREVGFHDTNPPRI
jgi:hypothetical protein